MLIIVACRSDDLYLRRTGELLYESMIRAQRRTSEYGYKP